MLEIINTSMTLTCNTHPVHWYVNSCKLPIFWQGNTYIQEGVLSQLRDYRMHYFIQS